MSEVEHSLNLSGKLNHADGFKNNEINKENCRNYQLIVYRPNTDDDETRSF